VRYRGLSGCLLCVVLLLRVCLPGPARAETLVVNSAEPWGDAVPGDGLCDFGDGVSCTLPDAVNVANEDPDKDLIVFAIPGAGPHLIPAAHVQITEPLVIDGTTQPGASRNTAAAGTNAVIPVVLTGDAGFGAGIRVDADDVELRGLWIRTPFGVCLWIAGDRARVSGVRIDSCFGSAIYLEGDAARIGSPLLGDRNLIHDAPNSQAVDLYGNGNFVINTWIGTDPDGEPSLSVPVGIRVHGADNTISDSVIATYQMGVDLFFGSSHTVLARNDFRGPGIYGLGDSGLFVSGGSGHQIGLPSPTLAHANRFSGWSYAIQFASGAGVDGVRVQGNAIGAEPDGTPSAKNTYGAYVVGSANTIGEAPTGVTGAGNRIAFNDYGLVLVGAGSVDNSLRGNRIHDNTARNLDIGNDGSRNDDPSPVYPPDPDDGANHLQNPPRLTSVIRSETETRFQGEIAAQAAATRSTSTRTRAARRRPPGSRAGPSISARRPWWRRRRRRSLRPPSTSRSR
jgi:hypothetical protein